MRANIRPECSEECCACRPMRMMMLLLPACAPNVTSTRTPSTRTHTHTHILAAQSNRTHLPPPSSLSAAHKHGSLTEEPFRAYSECTTACNMKRHRQSQHIRTRSRISMAIVFNLLLMSQYVKYIMCKRAPGWSMRSAWCRELILHEHTHTLTYANKHDNYFLLRSVCSVRPQFPEHTYTLPKTAITNRSLSVVVPCTAIPIVALLSLLTIVVLLPTFSSCPFEDIRMRSSCNTRWVVIFDVHNHMADHVSYLFPNVYYRCNLIAETTTTRPHKTTNGLCLHEFTNFESVCYEQNPHTWTQRQYRPIKVRSSGKRFRRRNSSLAYAARMWCR